MIICPKKKRSFGETDLKGDAERFGKGEGGSEVRRDSAQMVSGRMDYHQLSEEYEAAEKSGTGLCT